MYTVLSHALFGGSAYTVVVTASSAVNSSSPTTIVTIEKVIYNIHLDLEDNNKELLVLS
jgi:hypothetical protein